VVRSYLGTETSINYEDLDLLENLIRKKEAGVPGSNSKVLPRAASRAGSLNASPSNRFGLPSTKENSRSPNKLEGRVHSLAVLEAARADPNNSTIIDQDTLKKLRLSTGIERKIAKEGVKNDSRRILKSVFEKQSPKAFTAGRKSTIEKGALDQIMGVDRSGSYSTLQSATKQPKVQSVLSLPSL
jgi:hypothetical protein